jgi:branched-chain amino acid aminotransferase
VRIVLNGKLCDEADAKVAVSDRSFCYGDGLFETFRVHNGCAFRLADHIERLNNSAAALGFKVPFTIDDIEDHIDALVTECEMPDAMARIHLSRGVGKRGYSPRGVNLPTYVMAFHSAPEIDAGRPIAWRMKTSSYRLNPSDPLITHKTASRMTNVLAKAEAEEDGYDDAFFINLDGNVAEATCANVFWLEGNLVCTPPISSGALPGVTRLAILGICKKLGILTEEKDLPRDRLAVIDGAFLTLSSLGVIEIGRVDQSIFPIHETTRKLHREWWNTVIAETR